MDAHVSRMRSQQIRPRMSARFVLRLYRNVNACQCHLKSICVVFAINHGHSVVASTCLNLINFLNMNSCRLLCGNRNIHVKCYKLFIVYVL